MAFIRRLGGGNESACGSNDYALQILTGEARGVVNMGSGAQRQTPLLSALVVISAGEAPEQAAALRDTVAALKLPRRGRAG